ncbi:MAG: VOC family protein [Pseudomonadota bacterium]
MKLDSLDHLVLTVANVAETVRFYVDVLGMRMDRFRAADGTDRTALCFGAQKINLHQAGAEFEPKARKPTPGSADLCFLSETALSDWQLHIAAHGVVVEEGPVPRTGAMGPIISLYIRDPDGNLIELSNRV